MSGGLAIDRPADGVLRFRLDRPHALNAIDLALADALFAALDAAKADPAARAIVIAGAGEAFCAGYDIAEMRGFDAAAMRAAFAARDPLTLTIATHRLPVIAAVGGAAYGAGALIAFACDIRVGGPSARFRVTAASYGGANATWSLPGIVGASRAKEILMTSRVVDAPEAERIGLVDLLAADASCDAIAVDLAARVAAISPGGVQGIKRLINGRSGALEDDWRAEHEWMLRSLDDSANGGDAVFAATPVGRSRQPG